VLSEKNTALLLLLLMLLLQGFGTHAVDPIHVPRMFHECSTNIP
jgi:hypothetical protein